MKPERRHLHGHDAWKYLVWGTYQLTPRTKADLHLVCGLRVPNRIYFYAAYHPMKPERESPTQRARRR